MGIKLSNTGINTYFECPSAYEKKYIRKLSNKFKGSALYFGSAIDNGLNYMTEHKNDKDVLEKSLIEFYKAWEQGKDSAQQPIDLPLNPFITYSKSDFDIDLLDHAALQEVVTTNNDLQIGEVGENPFERRDRIYEDIKVRKYPAIPEKDRMFYAYTTWLALRKKGELLIKGYYEQILPLLEEVVLVQHDVELSEAADYEGSELSDEPNKIKGVVDLVVRFKKGATINGKVLNVTPKENVVTDNKTSSVEYEEGSVAESQQLALYKTLLNASEETGHLAIKKGAYIVLSKKLNKITHKTCKSCGHTSSTGQAKTCDNTVPNPDVKAKKKEMRCNGEWSKKVEFKVNTDIIIDTIPDAFADSVIENFDTVVKSIEGGNFPKNYDSCRNKFGGFCDFYDLCHFGDSKNIVDNSIKPKK